MKIPAHKDTIMVHCLATRPSWAKGKSIESIVKEVTRWHVVDRKWSGIAYALIIGLGGSVGMGRDLDGDGDVYEETAAAAKGWNKRAIHIALVGGYGSSASDDFAEHYTRQQEVALIREIEKIIEAAGRPMSVMGHNQVANKACPGFDVPMWWAKQRESVPKPMRVQRTFWTMIIDMLKGLKR